jgi:hypothetical protein
MKVKSSFTNIKRRLIARALINGSVDSVKFHKLYVMYAKYMNRTSPYGVHNAY